MAEHDGPYLHSQLLWRLSHEAHMNFDLREPEQDWFVCCFKAEKFPV